MSGNIDPVADFLAREQEDLAGLGVEDDPAMVPPPLGDVEQVGLAVEEEDQFAAFAQTNGGVADDVNFGVATDDLSNDLQNGLLIGGAGDLGGQEGADFAATTPQAPSAPRGEEPEKIKRWREEQKIRLQEKDDAELEKQNDWKEQAKKELADWYKNRAEQLEATKKSNRLAEEEFVRERDAELPGQEWERIARLCEFNPKSAKNTKDVARMRSLLLQLKAGQTQAPN